METNFVGIRKCIIVLGCHRSGTSALMGALYHLGIDIGTYVVTDHYENHSLMALNSKLLQSLGSEWDDIFPLPQNWLSRLDLDAYREKILQTFHAEFGDGTIWGFKDPRMCLLLPFWLPLLRSLNIEPLFVIPLRDPFEVAASLMKRDGFGLEKSLLIWMKHFFSAELDSRGYRRYFCRFDDLLQEPLHLLLEIGQYLGVTYPQPIEAAAGALGAFLQPSKKHHNHPAANDLANLPQAFSSLYSLLFSGKLAVLIGGERDQGMIDACRNRLKDELRFYSKAMAGGVHADPIHHGG